MSVNCCCKGCTDRTVGCHGLCEKYSAYKKELDRINATKNNERIFKMKYTNKYFGNFVWKNH